MEDDNSSSNQVYIVQTGGASLVKCKPLFTQDSKYLLCPSGKFVKVFSVATGECFQCLVGHAKEVTGISLHPKIKLQVLSSSLDGTIKVWDYEDGILLQSYTFHHPLYGVFCNSCYPTVGFFLQKQSDNKSELHKFKLQGVGTNANFEDVSTTILAKDISSTRISSCISLSKSLIAVAYSFYFLVFDNSVKVKSKNAVKHSLPKKVSLITCITCHPLEPTCATGHKNGEIRVWYNINDLEKVVFHVQHWHSVEVLALSYSATGSILLSGGHENVLVQWTSEGPQFLPRLGSEISNLAVSPDGTLFATCHLNNYVLIITNYCVIKQSIEGFTAAKSLFPCGLHYDEVTRSCVTNGKAGHLLFYICPSDTQLYNLDVVNRNFICSSDLEIPLSRTIITKIAFLKIMEDEKDYYMATHEFDQQRKRDQKLKFWKYDKLEQNWTLETIVSSPHFNNDVTSLCFHPQKSLCITTSLDGFVKFWARTKTGWTCDESTSYRGYQALDAVFSEDGSVLALAFEHVVLLSDSLQAENKNLFASFPSHIKSLKFGLESCCHLLLIALSNQIQCWNVISGASLWVSDVPDINFIVQDKFSEHMALFTKSKQIFIFKPNDGVPSFSHDLSIEVVAACFIPEPEKGIAWADKSSLYMVSKEATVNKFSKQLDEPSSLSRFGNKGTLNTPISSLLTAKVEKRSIDMAEAPLRHSTIDEAIKHIIYTPPHVLPPMSTLCDQFLSSLLFDQPQEESSDPPEQSQDQQNNGDQSKSEEMETQELTETEIRKYPADLLKDIDINPIDFDFLIPAFENLLNNPRRKK